MCFDSRFARHAQLRRRGGKHEGTEGRAKAAAARVAGDADTREEHGQGRGQERGSHVARGRTHDRATGAGTGVARERVPEKAHGSQPPLQPGTGECLSRAGRREAGVRLPSVFIDIL